MRSSPSRRWLGAHTRSQLAVIGGIVGTAAVTVGAPAATAVTSADPCNATTTACFASRNWWIGTDQRPAHGVSVKLQWGNKWGVQNPLADHIGLDTWIVYPSDPSGFSPYLMAGSEIGKTGYLGIPTAVPLYYWAGETASGSWDTPLSGSPGLSSYTTTISDADGDGCWDVAVGSDPANQRSACGLGSEVGIADQGLHFWVNNKPYKAKAKGSDSLYLDASGTWQAWPDLPPGGIGYKRPLVNQTGDGCVNQPSGFSGPMYIGTTGNCTAW